MAIYLASSAKVFPFLISILSQSRRNCPGSTRSPRGSPVTGDGGLLPGDFIKDQVAGDTRILETFRVIERGDPPHVVQLHLRFIGKPFAIPVYKNKSLAGNPGLEGCFVFGRLETKLPNNSQHMPHRCAGFLGHNKTITSSIRKTQVIEGTR